MKQSRKFIIFDCSIILIIIFFAAYLMFSTFSSGDGTLYIASKAWSDFAAHVPLIRSFSLGHNFPPEYPTFPGEPIRYHFLFYFLVGMLERLGVNLGFALNLTSSLGLAAFLSLVYYLTLQIFKSRTAGVLAVFLVIFHGSLGFLEYFSHYNNPIEAIVQIPNLRDFVGFGPWNGSRVSAFWNMNIYTNQRHLGVSYALVLWFLTPILLKRHVTRTHFLVNLFLMALLPLLHKAGYLLFVTVGLTYLVISRTKSLPQWFYFLVLSIFGLPALLWLPSNGTVSVVLGFLAPSKTLFGILQYWWWNFGPYLILIPFLLIFGAPQSQQLLFGFLPLFIMANLFQFSPDMINNHKLINFFLVGNAIAVAGWLSSLKPHKFKIVAITALFPLLTLSGIIDIFPIFNDHSVTLTDIAKEDSARWIVLNTPKSSVFLTTSYLYHPALLAGRKTFLDYGYFNWSMGYADSDRRRLLTKFFSQSHKATVCQVLKESGIDYVMLDERNQLDNIDIPESTLARAFKTAYESPGKLKIIKVEDNCHD